MSAFGGYGKTQLKNDRRTRTVRIKNAQMKSGDKNPWIFVPALFVFAFLIQKALYVSGNKTQERSLNSNCLLYFMKEGI